MTNSELIRIVLFMEKNTGINLKQKRTLVEGRLNNYLLHHNIGSYNDYMNFVENDISGKEAENLINILTTNHTYFMRETEHFKYFKQCVLPEFKKENEKSKDIRIWCGASSTGEEPYTLAMILKDFFIFEADQWDTQILATDISTEALHKAIAGKYTEENVSALPEIWKRRYFYRINQNEYQISKEIKNQVIYRKFNLMNSLPFRRNLDVVFLRNVMIYFDKDTKYDLLNRIYDVMQPGGYLFIGTTESIDKSEVKFKYVKPSVYRK